MVRAMPARVLEGWKRFEEVEPFGPRQEDRRAGEIASLLATIYRDKKVRREPFYPEDFFVSLSEIKPDKTKPKPPGQLLQIMEAMFLSKGGGEDKRSKRPRYEE